MRGFAKYTWVELKLFLREPGIVVSTMLFPIAMLLLTGFAWGNWAPPGRLAPVDLVIPALAGLTIATGGLFSLTVLVVSYRQAGFLRRLQVTPLHPLAILGADALIIFALMSATMVVVLGLGELLFGLNFYGRAIDFAGAFALGSASFFAIGLVLSGWFTTIRGAHAAASFVFLPMFMLSGLLAPREALPFHVQQLGTYLPLTPVLNLLNGFWVGHGWHQHVHDVQFLLAIVVVGVVVSTRTFRWQ